MLHELLLGAMGAVWVAGPGCLCGPPLSRLLPPAPCSAQPPLEGLIAFACERVSPQLERCKEMEQSLSLVPLETEPIDPTK